MKYAVRIRTTLERGLDSNKRIISPIGLLCPFILATKKCSKKNSIRLSVFRKDFAPTELRPLSGGSFRLPFGLWIAPPFGGCYSIRQPFGGSSSAVHFNDG